jgi:hypothetical protein
MTQCEEAMAGRGATRDAVKAAARGAAAWVRSVSMAVRVCLARLLSPVACSSRREGGEEA